MKFDRRTFLTTSLGLAAGASAGAVLTRAKFILGWSCFNSACKEKLFF